MVTVQMTLNDSLVKAVDKYAKKCRTSRSAVTRAALTDFLKKTAMIEQEKKHAAGYAKKTVKRGEFDFWLNEQVWPN